MLVCATCGRDIAVPEHLVAERDGLVRKRDALRQELAAATAELEKWERRRRRPSA
jgi:DNA-binding transcriptional regulator YiaG